MIRVSYSSNLTPDIFSFTFIDLDPYDRSPFFGARVSIVCTTKASLVQNPGDYPGHRFGGIQEALSAHILFLEKGIIAKIKSSIILFRRRDNHQHSKSEEGVC